MSARAETWAVKHLSKLSVPDPCVRRRVLMALAERHVDGPITLPTTDLNQQLRIDALWLWRALMVLRRCDALEASNIGGLMSVTLGCDFETETSAEGSALPTAGQEAGR